MIMSTGFSFGTNSGTSTGTSVLQNQGNFGGSTHSTTGGFQFGTATSTPVNLFGTSNSNMGFKTGVFGIPNQSSGLFATSSNAPATGFNFGSSISTSVSTGFGTGLSINTSTSTTPPSTTGLIAPTSTATFSFGTPASVTSSSTTSVVSGSSDLFNTTTSTSIPYLNFGTSTSSTPILGSSAITTTTRSVTFGLGDIKTTNTSSPGMAGLGGIASSQTKTGTTVATQKEVSPKEQPLPNEILQTVEQFKEMVKQQKLHSSDIARCSVRDFRKVEQEINLLNNLLNDVESQLQKNRQITEKLKYDTAKCLHNVEIAQRTQDTPPGLQYENIAPVKYFLELADVFEREMQTLKIQIESAEKYVKNHRNPDNLSPQDLAVGMRRLHETFVALAGRLQSVHGQVESQKEIYLNIRKQMCSEHISSSNPFETVSQSKTDLNVCNLRKALIYSPPKVATGPTPFSSLTHNNGNYLSSQQNQISISHSRTSINPVTSGMELTAFGLNTSVFGSTPLSHSSVGISSTNFQLQKPPTGNKRGKQ